MSRSPQEADLERVEHVAKDSLTSMEGKGRRQEWAVGNVKLHTYNVSLGSSRLGMFFWSYPVLLAWDDPTFMYPCCVVLAHGLPRTRVWDWIRQLSAAKTVPEGADHIKLPTVSTPRSWSSVLILKVRVGYIPQSLPWICMDNEKTVRPEWPV